MSTERRKRRVFVKTYGCQMNVYDSDRMAEALAPHGYERAEAAADADLVILNTCHIREKATEKVYSDLGRLRDLRSERLAQGGGDMLLAVAGCTAQAEGEAMLDRAPYIDLVVGPQSYHRLPELLARRQREGKSQLDTEFPLISKFDELVRHVEAAPPSAFLSIQEGCDKFCTFCVVPYTRGAEESRPAAAVLAEARMLVQAGARELVLLGQNVNAYHGEAPEGGEWTLARLIRAMAEIPDLARIRYTTSHPRDMDADLIRAHGEIPALMPFLHLPVQSGSDKVLKAMNRGYTADDFRRIVDALRAARPDIALSSDFITGFPGETDEDFAATMRLVEDVGFAQAYSFKYSGRPGTPATGMRGQLKDAVKSERLAVLQALLEEQSTAFNRATVGRKTDVLLERPGRHEGQLIGRSPWLQAVHVSAVDLKVGDMATVEITACHPHSLAGVLALASSRSAAA
ncbi:tRNA-i(6)A37 thiotransferase enzyme MiaB [Arboricoccus pini]|uniref:tRNA-2-methylthio-N(6)-dimethylallyladenosine synthase n=1 Tax=Arboricoccus pini TaxID=1963835 RepID=A0A212PYL7_9PROT|nr:tRNA (N6-isopentenyl adenosine(37)-C2)-methylthiotransferase MiaB [Arboricoccus pini]SNB52054.1 tRNA-i(6)A37 thiotransferase enzyme MiaB [Arboricoccus pini]